VRGLVLVAGVAGFGLRMQWSEADYRDTFLPGAPSQRAPLDNSTVAMHVDPEDAGHALAFVRFRLEKPLRSADRLG
jgi:hypothetical protein